MSNPQGISNESGAAFVDKFATNIDPLVQDVFEKLIESSKLANEIPVEQEYKYLSTYGSFRSSMGGISKRVLRLAQGLIDSQSANAGADRPNLNDVSDVNDLEEEFESIIDVVDSIVERVDVFIDEQNGIVPETKIAISKTANIMVKGKGSIFQYASNVVRPQEKWKDDIDNSTSPFVPKIKSKPNALVPLDPSIVEGKLSNSTFIDNQEIREHVMGTLGVPLAPTSFPHPYEYELRHLEYEPWMMSHRKEEIYLPLEESKVTYVDTEKALFDMIEILNFCTEIAIDLEAHQYRSFQGFTCLMQISTRKEDFLVDTLVLRRQMQAMNSFMTNPKIVKVLHGSDSDILWLQRDFGIYIVNLFDTGQAARVLEYPSYALSYLLKYYCGVVAEKQYQKADWRIRPLPEPMLKYAREDTHYLLYIYDRIRNDSLAKVGGSVQLLQAILNRSRELCLQRYEKEPCQEYTYMHLLSKFNSNLTIQQTEVFAAVYNWRDTIARLEDESTRYVLPNHMILQIADKMPEDDKSLQAVCVPVPPLVKMNLPELLKVIKTAKAAGLEKARLGAVPASFNSNPSFSSSGSNFYSSSYKTYPDLPDLPIDVTTSEELYKQAGWLTDSSSITNNHSGSHQGNAVEEPLSNSALSIGQAPVNIQFAGLGSSNGSMLGSGMFGPSVVEEDPTLMSGHVGIAQSTDSDTRMTAEAIRNSFNVDWLQRPQFSFADNEEEEEIENQTTTASDGPSPSKKNSSSEHDLFDGIPQSMQEIYHLSNKSKRNKKKREASETDNALLSSPQSPFILQDGEEDLDIRAAKRAKTTESEGDKADFMKEIGWASGTPTKLGGQTSSSTTEPKQSQNQQNEFTPFDYSKHSVPRPAPGFAQQQAARGQTTEASLNPYGKGSKSQKGPSKNRHGNHGGRSGSGGKSDH